jgi:hypothetical protein
MQTARGLLEGERVFRDGDLYKSYIKNVET